jgi:hypothetical protein
MTPSVQMREEQMAAFSEQACDVFVERVVDHIQEFFPAHYEAMGDADTAALVRRGIERAEAYGIREEALVCQYVDLMLLHGPDFDVNPASAWSQKILTNPKLDAPAKIDGINEITLVRNSE